MHAMDVATAGRGLRGCCKKSQADNQSKTAETFMTHLASTEKGRPRRKQAWYKSRSSTRREFYMRVNVIATCEMSVAPSGSIVTD
jgi:hypothetical protein